VAVRFAHVTGEYVFRYHKPEHGDEEMMPLLRVVAG
jgi:hypothetical protein